MSSSASGSNPYAVAVYNREHAASAAAAASSSAGPAARSIGFDRTARILGTTMVVSSLGQVTTDAIALGVNTGEANAARKRERIYANEAEAARQEELGYRRKEIELSERSLNASLVRQQEIAASEALEDAHFIRVDERELDATILHAQETARKEVEAEYELRYANLSQFPPKKTLTLEEEAAQNATYTKYVNQLETALANFDDYIMDDVGLKEAEEQLNQHGMTPPTPLPPPPTYNPHLTKSSLPTENLYEKKDVISPPPDWDPNSKTTYQSYQSPKYPVSFWVDQKNRLLQLDNHPWIYNPKENEFKDFFSPNYVHNSIVVQAAANGQNENMKKIDEFDFPVNK